MKFKLRGIDYSPPGSDVNRDPSTGIRYGILNQHTLGDCALDDFEPEYDAACPHCGEAWAENTQASYYPEDTARERYARRAGYYTTCEACERLVREGDEIPDEPSRIVYVGSDGTRASVDSSGDVWVFASPYFTRAAFCSPCAPGACSLGSPCDDGERAYCLGPDWFDADNPAPYPIYSVATGARVEEP